MTQQICSSYTLREGMTNERSLRALPVNRHGDYLIAPLLCIWSLSQSSLWNLLTQFYNTE